MVEVDIKVVPCEFEITKVENGRDCYVAKLYIVIDDMDMTTYSFWRRVEAEDCQYDMVSSGRSPYIKVIDVPVNFSSFPSMFLDIIDYVSHSNSD